MNKRRLFPLKKWEKQFLPVPSMPHAHGWAHRYKLQCHGRMSHGLGTWCMP